MRDYLNNELKIGDKVVFVEVVERSCIGMSFGTVGGFTPKKVRIGNNVVKPDRVVKIIENGKSLGVTNNLGV